MLAIVSLLTVAIVSILITRMATVALIHTGLTRQTARFQARSALSGVGYTTNESERLVNHPVRRRIILGLMLLGNAGIVGAISSLILTFVGQDEQSLTLKIGVLVVGLAALWTFASSRWVDRGISRLTDKALKRFTDLDVRDYAGLMRLAGDYTLAEMQVEPEDWLSNRKLSQAELRDEGIMVLGIERPDGSYVGAPTGDTLILAGDSLILYGRGAAIAEIDERRKGRSGDQRHRAAVARQERLSTEEERKDDKQRRSEPRSSES